MSVTIALVAEKGAGKSAFIEIVKKLLPDRKIASVRFSDIWVEILTLLGKEPSRQNISTLATAVRNALNDDGIRIPAMRKRLAAAGADVIVLDGLRKPEEAALVKERGGFLVYITANRRARYERSRERPEKGDEFGMTWDQFLAQEELLTEVSIHDIGITMADVTIENNGSLKEFEERIKEFVKTHIRPAIPRAYHAEP